MKHKPTRVVVCLDVRHRASQDVIAGVLRFAATHPDWDMQMRGNHPSNDGFAVGADWMPDGLIIDGTWRTREGARLVASRSLKGIVFAGTVPPHPCRVTHKVLATDDRGLAVAAARLFIRHGLRNFAFVGSGGGERWSVARMRLFRAALADAGFGLAVYAKPHRAGRGWKTAFAALTAWIGSLPTPCGIWAAHDQRAKHVIDVCRLNGIKIPEQVQVLGVDDESYICEQTVPPLSSLAPDFERGGFAAAEALNAMLGGKPPKPRKLSIPLKSVTERLSTTDISGAGTRVSRACDFIRRNACGTLTVRMVVRAVGGSERLLEKNFKSVLGHSICREIQYRRLDAAKRLLAETAHPIASIAAECGFGSDNYLKNLFKRRFGTTMSRYRGELR